VAPDRHPPREPGLTAAAAAAAATAAAAAAAVAHEASDPPVWVRPR
jgi:hypothetical protein